MALSTSLPFQAPNFPAYTGETYEKAILEALDEAMTAQRRLSHSKDAPTFENTVIALEKIHQTVAKAREPFALAVFDSRPDIQAAEEAIAGPLSRFESQLFQDEGIWKKLNVLIQEQSPHPSLPKDAVWLLEQYRQKFMRAGAHLPESDKKALQDLHSKLAEDGIQFSKNVLEATQTPCWIEHQEWLTGLRTETLEAAKQWATELGEPAKWAFKTDMPNTRRVLEESASPEFREKLWEAFFYRCNEGQFDNHHWMKEQLKTRAKIAKIMGYANWAEFTLDNMMARHPTQALNLMMEVWDKIKIEFEKQSIRLQQESTSIIRPSDWFHYADKVRQADYAFDAEKMSDYFLHHQVRDGLFKVVHQLFHLEFEKNTLPGFAENVQGYTVHRDGQHVGVLYLDDFQRQTKRGGAWMDSGRSQSNLDGHFVSPIVGNALNIRPPLQGEAKLSMEEVVTMFHELGHGLHGLLSKVRYPTQSGLMVPTDFVELPSQVLENWALQPEVMKSFARNEQGEIIPDALIESWQKAQRFDGVFDRAEYLVSALQDLRLHMLSEDEVDTLDFAVFEKALNEELDCPPLLKARYNLPSFNHIFGWDYSARYYAYLWSAVLDADAFQNFKEKGLFDPIEAKNLEENIYAIGHARPVEESFEIFKGRQPDTHALLEREGLLDSSPSKPSGGKFK